MITTRLQLASRIQLLLFRELGDRIDIERLLVNDVYARDVLLVCDAIGTEEFMTLAARFREASRGDAAGGRAPQDTDWSGDTSGFGVSHPAAAQPARRDDGWLAATRRWLRW
jgi:hypothetical protein